MVDSMVDEALDYCVKATDRDGTQKRKELVNMRPGELRRSLEHWQKRSPTPPRQKGARVEPLQQSAELQILEQRELRA